MRLLILPALQKRGGAPVEGASWVTGTRLASQADRATIKSTIKLRVACVKYQFSETSGARLLYRADRPPREPKEIRTRTPATGWLSDSFLRTVFGWRGRVILPSLLAGTLGKERSVAARRSDRYPVLLGNAERASATSEFAFPLVTSIEHAGMYPEAAVLCWDRDRRRVRWEA